MPETGWLRRYRVRAHGSIDQARLDELRDGIAVDGLGEHVLTTAVQPAVEKGRAAGDAVARLLAGEQAASIRFTCTFREGTTTGPVPSPEPAS